MKILMVLMGLEIGGAETHVVELSRCLQQQGHEILVVSNGGAYETDLSTQGIRHYHAPLHRRTAGSMFISLIRLRRIIRQEQPDLVHAHARIPAFLCGLLQKAMKFPLITSAHWVFAVTPLLRLMTDWGDHTVAVSEDIKGYLMENYQVPSHQISVTINGIDTDAFAPVISDTSIREELQLHGPVIGLVSRLDESRALAAENLIAIAPRLAQRIPNIEILIVGGGDHESVLRSKASQINATYGRTLVHMTGPRTDIASLLSAMDVFVGVSRAALEAMSAGKPVILAGNEGYMGIFTHEKLEVAKQTNFCLRGQPMITEDLFLADAITLLTAPTAQLETLASFGRNLVLTQYSLRRMTDDYLSAYRQVLRRKTPANAVISGYYGFGNLGDDAILQAISRQLEPFPITLTALSQNPKETIRQYNIPAVQRFALPLVIWTIFRSDLLIFGGGSLLQDATSTRSLRYYLWVIHMAQLLRKPVFLYANGIGPLNRNKNRQRVRRTLERCHTITLRDKDSADELCKLGLSPDALVVTGDPAFTLDPIPQQEALALLASLGIPTDQGIIGISVRPCGNAPSIADTFAALGDRIAIELHKTVVLVVMQEASDLSITQEIVRKMTAPAHILQLSNQAAAMLGVISCMEALVSMRLHSIIFAAKARVPMVGCVYDPKVSAFLNLLQMPSCGTPQTITVDSAYQSLVTLLTHQEARQQLSLRVQAIEQMAAETPHILVELLDTLPNR